MCRSEGSPAFSRAAPSTTRAGSRPCRATAGACWDFEDVREHYLRSALRIDASPAAKRRPARYLMLSRAVTAEVTERDLRTNGGGRARPIAVRFVWLCEGFAGGRRLGHHGRARPAQIDLVRGEAGLCNRCASAFRTKASTGSTLHLVNDRPEAVAGTLVIECLKDGGRAVVTGRRSVELGGRDSLSVSAFELFGAFFDAGYAYRFGPPAHDLVVARLEGAEGETLAEAFHVLEPARAGRHNSDVAATVEQVGQHWRLTLSAERAALFVQIQDEAFAPSDNWFHLAPGRPRQVTLVRLPDADEAAKPMGYDPRGDHRGAAGIQGRIGRTPTCARDWLRFGQKFRGV